MTRSSNPLSEWVLHEGHLWHILTRLGRLGVILLVGYSVSVGRQARLFIIWEPDEVRVRIWGNIGSDACAEMIGEIWVSVCESPIGCIREESRGFLCPIVFNQSSRYSRRSSFSIGSVEEGNMGLGRMLLGIPEYWGDWRTCFGVYPTRMRSLRFSPQYIFSQACN